MGNLFSFCFEQKNEKIDQKPPIVQDYVPKYVDHVHTDEVHGEKYYQNIIDQATSKFINATPRPARADNDPMVQEIRQRILNTTLNPIAQSAQPPPSPPARSLIEQNINPDIVNQNRTVLNVLSQPVSLQTQNLETTSDEIAALVSRQLFQNVEDNVQSLVSFRPTSSQNQSR